MYIYIYIHIIFIKNKSESLEMIFFAIGSSSDVSFISSKYRKFSVPRWPKKGDNNTGPLKTPQAP